MDALVEHIRHLSPVILDTDDKFLFIGTRKVCLSSVYDCLGARNINRKDRKNLWKHKIATTDISKLFKFTIARNPWERMVSSFHYLQQELRRINKQVKFQEFVKTKFRKKGVSCDSHFEYQYPKFYFDGEIFVDFIGRLERIEDDWKYIASKIDCDPMLPHENKSRHNPYQEYYDNECIEIIGDIYQKDIELLGYKF